jgi:hypothetical protein
VHLRFWHSTQASAKRIEPPSEGQAETLTGRAWGRVAMRFSCSFAA